MSKTLEIEKKNDVTKKTDKKETKIKSFHPIFFKSKSNEYTYLISDFSIFSNGEINAYDIEDKIKKCIERIDLELLKELKFDCESSLFSVQSESMENLNKLNMYILDMIK